MPKGKINNYCEKTARSEDLKTRWVSDECYEEFVLIRNFFRHCKRDSKFLYQVLVFDQINLKFTGHDLMIMAKLILNKQKLSLIINGHSLDSLTEDLIINTDSSINNCYKPIISAYKELLESNAVINESIASRINKKRVRKPEMS